MKLKNLLARLQGKRLAYDTPDQVADLLREQTHRIIDARRPLHQAGAASLASQLAYQPGLADLRAEAYESALYLDALYLAARAQGHPALAGRLQAAADGMKEAASLLALAVHATVPEPSTTPGIPAQRAA